MGYYCNLYSNSSYRISWFLCVRSDVTPSSLHRKCKGCATFFNLRHILKYCKGCLVIAQHDEVRDGLLYIYRRAFPSNCICSKPLIHQGCIRSEVGARKKSDILKTRDDVLIWGLWEQHTDVIIDVKIVDVNADSYRYEPMDKLVARWKKQINMNTIRTATNNRKNFSGCYFCWCHARKGGPGHTHSFESTQGSENGWTHFARACIYYWPDHNHGCKVVIKNDPQRFTSQSPVVLGDRLGPSIGPWLGTIKHAP